MNDLWLLVDESFDALTFAVIVSLVVFLLMIAWGQ